MLKIFYQTLLPLTAAGSVTMLLLLALTPLAKRMSCRWQYYVRLIPLVAFTVPFAFPLPFLPQLPAMSQAEGAPSRATAAVEILGAAAQPPPLATAAISPLQALALLWAVGAMAFVCYHLFAWAHFHLAAVRHSAPVTDKAMLRRLEACRLQKKFTRRVRLSVCPRIGGPILSGVLSPVILLPRGDIPPRELRFIFMHELTHCKRGDLACKLAALAVKSLHWFNPLAHLLAKQIDELCELSCDETLVRDMSNRQRRQYAFTILNQMDSALCKLPVAVSGFSGEKSRVKRRLTLIMNFQKNKRSLLTAGIGAAACLCVMAVITASALNAKPTAPPVPKSAPAVGALPLGNETDAYQREVARLNQNIQQLKKQQQALEAQILQAETPLDEAAQNRKRLEEIQAQQQALQKITAAPRGTEAAATASESETTAARLKKMKLIWPIGTLAASEVDEETGEEKKTNFISIPIWGYWGHTGNDIMAPEDSEILAAAGGTVVTSAYTATGYGKYIVLNHGNGVTSLYGHCSDLLVSTGDEVKQGDLIAKVGRSGNATGYYCHFELRNGGQYLDAREYIGYSAP